MSGTPRRPGLTILVGVVAGALSGLLGIGGGLVVGPALALAGMPLRKATGTALLAVAPIAAVGVAAELLTAPGHLVVWAALCVAAGGQVGAPIGARLLRGLAERGLALLFLLLLLFAALRSLGVLGVAPPPEALAGLGGGGGSTGAALAVAAGIAAGVASSLFGIGGGVVVVPALVFLVGGFTFHEAAGTSLLAMIPTALRAAWLAARDGRIQAAAAWRLVPAALVAAGGAVLLRNRVLAPPELARLFGLFLLFSFFRLLGRLRGDGPAGAGPGT